MTNQVIPAEAVEAAAKVLFKTQTFNDWESLDPRIRPIWISKARAALEAAAPHMLAGAWDEGYGGAIDAFDGRNVSNPYRTTNAR